ncbi:hypothetical protein DYQ86_01420 [Acidobacteria bacterium AB60]|nr:hypothetical protein DYQ86_01420 [Acidobacteria bacterium AB60]
MLLRASIPVETGNAAVKAGTLGPTITQILAGINHEAAYFYADDEGRRCASVVLDMKSSSEMPALAEPWFLAFNANVSFRPVMTREDLAEGGPGFSQAIQDFGK